MKTAAVLLAGGVFAVLTAENPAPAKPPSAPNKPAATPTVAPAPKAPTDPVLVTLSSQLKRLLKTSQPLATVTWDTADGGETLVAQYQTQSFLIYGRGKTGQIAATPDAEIGPNFQGFRLKLCTRPGHYDGPLDLPQDLRGPYWTTYINAIPLSSGSRYLWVTLSYGDRINPLLLKQLKLLALSLGAATPGGGTKKGPVATF